MTEAEEEEEQVVGDLQGGMRPATRAHPHRLPPAQARL